MDLYTFRVVASNGTNSSISTVDLQGTPGTSTTTLTTTPNPSIQSQSVTLQATVTTPLGAPTGTVTFKEGSTILGTGTLDAMGHATFNTASLTVGSHFLTAVYGGDTNFQGSTSATAFHTVNYSTSTSLMASPGTAVSGQPISLTATVSSGGGGTPTGSVSFYDGGTLLGSASLNGSGQATYITTALGAGTHSTLAQYGGATNFAQSASTFVPVTVNKASTTTTISSSVNPSATGQSVMFTAVVAVVSPGIGTATGSVTFRDGATTIGSGTLSSGQATFATAALTAGSHSITALYAGDTNFTTSTSGAVSQMVQTVQPPAGVTAAATSPTVVAVSWPAVFGAASYEVARSASATTFSIIGNPIGATYSDTTAAANTAYLYIVRAVDGAGTRTNYSSADLATTVIFTDDPAVGGVTPIKAVHIMALRTAVQAVRTLAVLSGASFTDSIDNTTPVKAVHVSELRSALDAARAALGLPAIAYTDPTLTAGSTVARAAHVQELRLGVK